MENDIYVVCWFDGNEAIAMAGTRKSKGMISPLAVERREIPASAVANGVINVNDDNRQVISTLVRCVANLLTTTLNENYTVRGIYFVAMPRSMRSIVTSGEKVLATRSYVTEADVRECREKAREGISADLKLLCLYENDFELDGKSSRHAIDEVAKKLRMNALSVVVGKRFSSDYSVMLPKDVALAGVLPASVAASMAVTTPEERFEGAISVHFCDSTTLFTAYRDDRVLATCVVPFGEQDVIHDLCCEVCDNTNDNVWRKIYGRWNFNAKAKDLHITDSFSGNSLVDDEKVERMLYCAEVRIREILNIGLEWFRAQVREYDEVSKKIVFSGCIAEKEGFGRFAESLYENTECRSGNANQIISDESYFDDVNYIPLVGAMLLATDNCVERKAKQNLEEIQRKAEEERRQEEERLRLEEEERARQEQEKKKGKAKDVVRTLFGFNSNRDL